MWGAIAAFLLCGNAAGQGPLACVTNAAVTPAVRAEGLTEKTGDIVVSCTGGAPFASGAVLPTANFELIAARASRRRPVRTMLHRETKEHPMNSLWWPRVGRK